MAKPPVASEGKIVKIGEKSKKVLLCENCKTKSAYKKGTPVTLIGLLSLAFICISIPFIIPQDITVNIYISIVLGILSIYCCFIIFLPHWLFDNKLGQVDATKNDIADYL